MYKADFEVGLDKVSLEGDSAMDIVMKLCHYQDFECLLRMARIYEDKRNQKEVDKLEIFVEKMYDNKLTIKDLKNLNIQLSLGPFKCSGIFELGT